MKLKTKILILAASAFAVVAATTLDSYLVSVGTGVHLLVDNTSADYDRLCFGGTSSSFPALKRSGAILQLRLADDSADAGLRLKLVNVQLATTPGTPTNGFVIFAVSNLLKCIGPSGTVTTLAQP